jgi:hypothetical protein
MLVKNPMGSWLEVEILLDRRFAGAHSLDLTLAFGEIN